MGEIIVTDEWQTVEEGQAIPAGCHVRMSLQSGKKEIKLLNPADKNKQIMTIPPTTKSVITATTTSTTTTTTTTKTTTTTTTSDYEENKESVMTKDMKNPKDWPGLMKWSMQYHDGTDQSTLLEEMSEGRKIWLKEALENLSMSEAKLMAELLTTIAKDHSKYFLENGFDKEEIATKEEALENLLEFVDSLDNASDVINLGGFEPVVDLLQANFYPSIQWRAADIIGNIFQHNPYAQSIGLERNCMEVLFTLLESSNKQCQVKGIFALSALVKSNESASKALLLNDNCGRIHKVIGTHYKDNAKFATKAAFLILYLLDENYINAENLVKMNTISVLSTILSWKEVDIASREHRPLIEQCLRLLCSLSSATVGREAMIENKTKILTGLENIKTIILQLNAEDQECYTEEMTNIHSIQSIIK